MTKRLNYVHASCRKRAFFIKKLVSKTKKDKHLVSLSGYFSQTDKLKNKE